MRTWDQVKARVAYQGLREPRAKTTARGFSFSFTIG
jgi:hypothetical protein